MRILVYPHSLSIGGSQINAIELAAAVQALGHESVVFGPPGPLVDRVAELGMDFIESPKAGRRPSPAVARALNREIASRDIDIVHGYEWPPILEAVLATRNARKAIPVGTVMSMAVAPFIPSTMPLVVGTQQIAAAERRNGRRYVGVIEPPVDTMYNSAIDLAGIEEFKREWSLDDDQVTVVCVTRLSREMKLEGVLSAIRTIGQLASDHAVRLVIVGGGPAWGEVSAAAAQVNQRCGRDAVVLTGALIDPRPAYASADISIAMGGSALRSLSFGCPLIVQGENGFFRLLDESSLSQFEWQGWYGYGPSSTSGSDRLKDILVPLLADVERRKILGEFGRNIVVERFSMQHASLRQEKFYEDNRNYAAGMFARGLDDLRSTVRYVRYQGHRQFRRILGRSASDDFNSRPVARTEARRTKNSQAAQSAKPGGYPVLHFSGQSWDAVVGTNRQMLSALARYRSVLWVDPPASWWYRFRNGISTPRLSQVAPNISRLSVVIPVGVNRPGIRLVARHLMIWQAKRLITSAGGCTAVMTSSPDPILNRFRSMDSCRIYYATDDFVAGSDLIMMSKRYLVRSRAKNFANADLVLAVSAPLARILDHARGIVKVFENGCNPAHYADVGSTSVADDVALSRPIAGVIGQLNDRIDAELLESVADTGASLLLVGPRCATGAELNRRLDDLLDRDNVQWVGGQSYDRLPQYMAAIDVGLTPYLESDFNTASFPLKTLEYISAGRPVVSTDSPVARSIDPELVTLASSARQFAESTSALLAKVPDQHSIEMRLRFAEQHSWQHRARELDSLIRACMDSGGQEL